MGHLFKQRVDEPLTNSLQQGKRFFFLYGDGIKDLFLEDICNGVVSLKENVQNCFLNRDDCEIFVTVNTDGVNVLRKRENEIIDISSRYLKLPDKEKSEMPGDDEEGDGQKNEGKSNEAKKLEENIKYSRKKDTILPVDNVDKLWITIWKILSRVDFLLYYIDCIRHHLI